MKCKNCGAKITKTTQFCTQCGTPITPKKAYPEESTPAVAMPQKQSRPLSAVGKNRYVNLLVTLVVIVLVVLFTMFITTSLPNMLKSTGAGKAAKDYYKAFNAGDAEKMVSLVPKDAVADICREFQITEEDLTNEVNSLMRDNEVSAEYGWDYPIESDKVKTDVTSNHSWDVSPFNVSPLDYDYFYNLEVYDITKISSLSVTVSCDDNNYADEDVDFTAYKYNGDWYLTDALDLIILAAMSC